MQRKSSDLKEQFKDEINHELQEEDFAWGEADALQKFLAYKAAPLEIDCDVSEKAFESYKKYPYLNGRAAEIKIKDQEKENGFKKELTLAGHTYRGDTMTSGWWFVQQILAYYTKDGYQKKCLHGIRINVKKIPNFRKYVKWDELCEYLKVEDVEGFMASFEKFLSCIHSAGNMIMVPMHFNAERCGRYAVWDCWDITLHAVCSWYRCNTDLKKVELDKVDAEKDRWLIKLFSKGACEAKICSVLECKHWLATYFANAGDFIRQNLLQDYWEPGQDDDWENGHVKALIDNKAIEEEDADKFFRGCTIKYKPKRGDAQQMKAYFDHFVERTQKRENRINGVGDDSQ